MSIIVKNSQLSNETVSALNTLVEMEINAAVAFRLMRIIKELTSIIDDKLKMERRILDKYTEKDELGNPISAKDGSGNPIEGTVNITNPDQFTSEMQELMDIENEIPYEKIDFEDLNLKTARVKDLIKLEFLFK
jgi:hypothetical protein